MDSVYSDDKILSDCSYYWLSSIAVRQESSKQVCNKQICNKFGCGQQQGE